MINPARDALRRWPAIIFASLLAASCSQEPADGGPKGAPHETRNTGSAMQGLTAQVSLADDSLRFADTAMVYVFLREPGSRMPLAVEQFPARLLPRTVNFSGDQSGPLELVTRLSPGGRVDAGPDDMEAILTIPGFSHPPQNYDMVLDGEAPVQASKPSDVEASTAAGSAGPVSIPVLVEIEEGHPFPSDAVVFLVARNPGTPMPLAVKRLSIAELPAQVELSDEDAMMVTNRLSDAERVSLFARVSTTGTVARSDSDWVSETIQVTSATAAEASLKLTMSPPLSR